MTTTEPIIIPIEGDPSDFIKDSAKVNSELDKMTRNTKGASGANTGMAQAAKSASISITDLRSAYMIAADVARVAGQVWQATGQEFVNYAEQVKNMSRSLGASAEETSRIIQVADDVRISYESLGVAMKTAQKNGIQPNIEGLAKLADQYKAIQSPTERTKFLLDTFGKSGLEMGKLMEKGGDGVRAMAGEVDKALIVTEKGIQASDQYQAALDDFNDSVLALKISIGNELLPTMTKMLVGLSHTSEIREEANRLMREGIANNREEAMSMAAATIQAAAAEDSLASSAQDVAGSLDDSSEAMSGQEAAVKAAEDALNDYKDMLEQVSQANQDAEGFIQSYADSQKDYVQSHADAAKQLQDAIAEGDKDAIAKAQQGIQELEATWHESTQKMIYDMALAKVELGGYTDAEFAAMQRIAVEKGIRTQEQADQAIRMMEEANAIAAGVAADEAVIREQSKIDAQMTELEKQAEIAKTGEVAVQSAEQSAQAQAQFAGVVDSATLSLMRQASAARTAAASVAAIKYPGLSTGKPYVAPKGTTGGKSPDERDSGGAGFAGVPYIINPKAGPEMFIPSTNGTFIPNIDKKLSGGGSTYNITINNPKREAAEDTMRNMLQKLAYTGVPT